MTDQTTTPPDMGLRAAEYVLRLLPRAEERDFEKALTESPALMAEVARWNDRFAGLDAEFEEVAPPKKTKAAVMERLFGEPQARRVPIWQRLGLWQGLSFAGIGLAAVFAWQLTQTPPTPTPAPLYVSEVAAEDQSLRLLAVYDSATARLQVTRTAGAPDAGRVHELWAIAGDNAPVSLGVLASDGTNSVTLPQGISPQGLVLAVSDEPPGGSPTGQPTGAVLAVGQVTAL